MTNVSQLAMPVARPGDASNATARLGWRPRVGFAALVAEMVEADLREAERDHLVKSSGYPVYAPHE